MLGYNAAWSGFRQHPTILLLKPLCLTHTLCSSCTHPTAVDRSSVVANSLLQDFVGCLPLASIVGCWLCCNDSGWRSTQTVPIDGLASIRSSIFAMEDGAQLFVLYILWSVERIGWIDLDTYCMRSFTATDFRFSQSAVDSPAVPCSRLSMSAPSFEVYVCVVSHARSASIASSLMSANPISCRPIVRPPVVVNTCFRLHPERSERNSLCQHLL